MPTDQTFRNNIKYFQIELFLLACWYNIKIHKFCGLFPSLGNPDPQIFNIVPSSLRYFASQRIEKRKKTQEMRLSNRRETIARKNFGTWKMLFIFPKRWTREICLKLKFYGQIRIDKIADKNNKLNDEKRFSKLKKKSIQRTVCPTGKKHFKLYLLKFLNNQTANRRNQKRCWEKA